MTPKPKSLILTSVSNPRVKYAVKLRDRRDRDSAGLMPIEGMRELGMALEHGHPIKELFYCPEQFTDSSRAADLVCKAEAQGAALIETDTTVFAKLSYRNTPDGLLGLGTLAGRPLADLVLTSNPLLMIAVGIEKPGNLGAILRSADAAGADAVIVCDRVVDISHPNVVRASLGTLFSTPVIETDSTSALAFLREHGIPLAAAIPEGDTDIWEAPLDEPVAVAVGCEATGLGQEWLAAARISLRIPMFGAADSLNAAVASALIMYESRRSRIKKGAAPRR